MSPYAGALINATPLFKSVAGITYLADCVKKEWKNSFTAPDELYALLRTPEIPCAASVEKAPDGTLTVRPLGVRIPSNGENISPVELKVAIRCVLRCLECLHSKGFVHRDIRWSNIIRDYRYREDGRIGSCTFKVIDFEYSAAEGAPMCIAGYIFGDLVPFGQPYTSRHDLHCVGELIRTWMRTNRSTAMYPTADAERDMKSFVQALQRTTDGFVSATDARNHPWLSQGTIDDF
jgi:serine/threonine protein kinase